MKINISNSNNHRTLSNGQRGEVYEVNGDQVAVIFDPPTEKLHGGDVDVTSKEENAKPSIYWVDGMPLPCFSDMPFVVRFDLTTFIWSDFPCTLAQDIAHDHDIESEDWHIALEALCEVISQKISSHMFCINFENMLLYCSYVGDLIQ
jgi:hypothetical protein